jgi:hypothetical protein
MRSTITGMALAAALLSAPAAFAQQTQPQQGTVGSPAAPGGGGTSMSQGTPNGASPAAQAPAAGTPRSGDTNAVTGTTGATAPGAAPGTVAGGAPATDAPRPTVATPVAGANSFTEGQARSRITEAGYTDVTDLKKDDQGVWRGKAMRNGASTEVGLDFKGNVVAGPAPAAAR